ncbi:MAG TPA: restriction endonuclease subunit S [Anaerolineales bacterium]|nr:restriction endonuclease subunit S [Anaerolineales bacterium]HNS60297.1 restriction endonuclease subunit S [Anaerolineales bacterium]
MNKTLLPKLRFPKFQDEWKNESLGEVYSFKSTNSFSRDQLNYKNGSVKNVHYGDIHTKFATLFDVTKEKVPFINPQESLERIALESYCIEGDIVFADASEDLNDVGKSIEIVNVNNEKLVSGMHTLLARQKEKKLIVGFGGYLFKSDGIRLQIKKEAQGAKVLGISANRLLNIDLCFPSDKKEQQKISDCLTSLDNLIAAQSQKIDALQSYKKGLMQNLFPAEGESVPRLRFPEFQSAGEWEEEKLGNVSIFVNERISLEKLTLDNYISTENILPDYGGVTRASKLPQSGSAIQFKVNDVLISNIRPYLKKVWFSNKDGGSSNDVIVVRAKEGIDTKYLAFMLKNDAFIEYVMKGAKGVKMPRGDISLMKEYPLVYPPIQEQNKIADVLTTIDEQISAQGEALAALKVHKKGLMQGLFASGGGAG